ncbi:unnamed protein product [Paramecium sonneborni]|uniref:Palmitoyltransferase n=1 Tax=Paramecium sonneborni TaxID=65129 RepID=A0A8S1RFZ9_9CILI|nr:unnamed protein product [Paramecium sonneborni]
MIKLAPILYGFMQIYLLSIFSIVDDGLFEKQNIGTYYLYLMIILSLIFYGFTAFKDPGFVTINDYQYTDSSNPYQKKKQQQFHALPRNSQLRTKEQIAEEHIDLKVDNQIKEKPKNKDEFEMECEASIDEQNFADNDIPNIENNVKSYEKTPEKSKTPSKMNSQTQSPHQNNNIVSSQILSQGSTNNNNKNNNTNRQTDPPFNYQQEIINIEQVEHQQQSPKSSNNEKNIDQSVHHGNSMFIEKRYCPICNQDQIIRSKHCRKCNRCIALYDHHCPWQLYWRTQQMCFLLVSLILDLRNSICDERSFSTYRFLFLQWIIFHFSHHQFIIINFNGINGIKFITVSFFVDFQKYDYLGIQELEENFVSQRFSIIVRVTIQYWMETKSQIILSLLCTQIDQLGIQQLKSKFYKMNNQSINQIQQQHQYEEIEQALQLQCDFVDKIVSNLNVVNKDLLNIQSQPLELWQIEKNNYIKSIADLKAQIDKIQSHYDLEISQREEQFQTAQLKVQEEHNLLIQYKDNQILKLQQEIKLLIKSKEDLQSQVQQSKKITNEPNSVTQKLQFEKEINKLKDENKALKIQLQQLQDQNAKLEENQLRKHQLFQEQLNIKQKEINQVKELAQVILDQRTQIEDFFVESLQKLELGQDLQIKSLPQSAKIQILKEIIVAFTKQKH